MAVNQLDTPRQFVTDSSGRLLVKPRHKAALRVPVYGAPKPVSTTTAKAGQDRINLSGAGVDQGGVFSPNAYHSFASVLELGTTSPRLPACTAAVTTDCASSPTEKAGDIQYVGAGSNGEVMWFGLSTYGDWPSVGNINIPYVDYDVDGDLEPDFETYLQPVTDTDLLYAWTEDLHTGDLVDLEPVNFSDGNRDTNVFDTDVVTMPVFLDALGLPTDGSSAPITYSTGVFSGVTGTDADHADDVEFDAGSPALSTDSPLYDDLGGTFIPVTKGEGSVDALVLHLHGRAGHRAEVVTLP
jgi:hypothetical protein